MLEETGTKVCISTVKRVLCRHNLKGRLARKKPQLQNRHKKATLRFATAHGDKDCTFWRKCITGLNMSIYHMELPSFLRTRIDWRDSEERLCFWPF
jgi:hypothetical protein